MRPLNSSLLTGSPLAATLLVGLLSLVTAAPLSGLFGGGPAAWLGALLLAAAIWAAALWAIYATMFPTVSVDPDRGMLRVRGRDYPASALRAATRSVSAGGIAAYLTYRFTLDDGRRFRLVAVGRPFRGLSPEALRALRPVIAASAIAEPDGLTPDQQRVRSSLQVNQRAVPVGREALLQDLDELLSSSPATPPQPSADTMAADAAAEAPFDAAPFLADDAEAAATIQERAGRLFVWTRVTAAVAWLGVLLIILFAILVLVTENEAPVAQPSGPSFVPLLMASIALAAIAGGTWAVLADVAVRRVRRIADEWWHRADPAARRRGAPAPYVRIDVTGARRVATTTAFVCSVLAVITVPTTVAAVFEPSVRLIAAPLAMVSAVLVAGSIVGWRRSRRDARAAAERSAMRAGERFGIGRPS